MNQTALDGAGKLIIDQSFVLGLMSAFVCSFLINIFLVHSHSHEDWRLSKENSIPNDVFKRAFRIYEQIPFNICLLGFLEVIFYYFAIYLNQPELIVAWLAFKVASKWNTWSTIGKVPEHLQDINGFDYLEAKNKVATVTLQRWFLGNLLNVFGGVVSVFSGKVLSKLLSLIN